MKRTDRLTNWIAILLFIALVAYLAAYAFSALRSGTVTAEAVAVELDVGGIANGIVVREERVLHSDEPYVDVLVSEGARIAKGSTLATAIRSDLGRERASRMHELELEISRVSTALNSRSNADDLTRRNEALSTGVKELASAVARHRLSSLDTAALHLTTLLFPADEDDISEARLAQLRAELASLQNSSSGDATPLYAEAAGSFSSVVDGYEHLRLADVENITPGELAELINSAESVPGSAYGKLVEGFDWYFAAVMSSVDAAKLTVGRSATLNFGRWYSGDVAARVQSISPSEDGSVVVVFRCSTALADTLAMRTVSAEVVFESYSGIRVPAQAVQTDDETQTTFVWCVTAQQLERKELDIIYCAEDFVIAAPNRTADTLRAGNTVVVSGEDLYEGKVIE